MFQGKKLATYVVAMVAKLPQGYINNSLVFRYMKFIFGMEVLKDNGG